MSKEDIRKFQEELQKNAELERKLDALQLSHENFEELISLAKEAGFDFTLDELKEANSKPVTEELSIDELEKVVGGLTNARGEWITTVAFGCERWEASQSTWLAVKGQCGSCTHWHYTGLLPLCYLGVPGRCLCLR